MNYLFGIVGAVLLAAWVVRAFLAAASEDYKVRS